MSEVLQKTPTYLRRTPLSSFFGSEDRRTRPDIQSSESKIESKIAIGPVVRPDHGSFPLLQYCTACERFCDPQLRPRSITRTRRTTYGNRESSPANFEPVRPIHILIQSSRRAHAKPSSRTATISIPNNISIPKPEYITDGSGRTAVRQGD